MEFGKKIKQLRAKAGLTQEQLAEKIGITAQSVSKWENSVVMPDIMLLPRIAEVFGVSIDELFDLSTGEKLNRIENRMNIEDELPRDIYWEYEEFLKTQAAGGEHKKRATGLLAFLYWHQMNAAAMKVRTYAKEAIRQNPSEKDCQWMLNMAEGHYVWDWNLSNHLKAISFYRELVEAHPDVRLPYYYLIDNLIADRRAGEAERYLGRLEVLPDADHVMTEVYRAHIALLRFDEKTADSIIEALNEKYPDNETCLFETAQYYARKCNYARAIGFYERSFEKSSRRPRYTDELHGIALIYEIEGDYGAAAATYGRIIDLLRDEWGMTEETELQHAMKEKARLIEAGQSKRS